MAQDIPEWAMERATKIADQYDETWLNSFALYIAEKEEPPVDPLLIEAREIVACFYTENAQAVTDGNYDNSRRISVALEALKRGLELAKQEQSS